MGRHSGALCTACQQRILVHDGKLVAHRHSFPELGTSLPCVGSHSRAPQNWSPTPPPVSTAHSDEELIDALIEDARTSRLDRPQLDAYISAIHRTGAPDVPGDT